MRGTLIIGLAIVLLIVAILVIKNMGNDNPGVTETQAEKYTERAQSAADNANKRIQDIRKQVTGSE